MYKSRLRLIVFVGVVAVLAIAWAVAGLPTPRASFPWPPSQTPTPTASATDTATATASPAPTQTPFVFPTQPPSPTPTASPTATRPTDTPSPTPTATLTPFPTATESVIYTVVISNTFARKVPSLQATQLRGLAKGQTYTVKARSADGIWVKLDLSDTTQADWVPAAFGALQGPPDNVPVVGPTPARPAKIATPAETATSVMADFPYLPVVSAHSRDIYRYGLLLGNNPHVFIKVGDCQATTPYFLAAFDNAKSYHLGEKYAYLQETIQQFAGSFSHESTAANIGFGSTTVLDPTWADPHTCIPGESPLVCEYRVMRPTFALISLGTNDTWETDERFEKDLRQIIEYLTHQGVVPILSTKADNVEGDGRFNRLTIRLATEYDLPLWDFWTITRNLPNFGITDNYHLSWGPAVFDDPKNMLLGWPWRNLTALQVLDAVWRSVR